MNGYSTLVKCVIIVALCLLAVVNTVVMKDSTIAITASTVIAGMSGYTIIKEIKNGKG